MRWVLAGLAVLLLAAGAGGYAAWQWWEARAEQDRAIAAAEAFADAWESQDGEALVTATLGDEDAASTILEASEGLAPEELTVELVDVAVADAADGRALAAYGVAWQLEGLGEWSYEVEARLRRDAEQWGVAWTPTALHPQLESGQRLGRVREWPERAPILDPDGETLVGPGEVVEVGIEPQAVDDADELAGRLAELTPADREQVVSLLDRDDLEPDWFYPVAELPPDEADDVAEELDQLAGVVWRPTEGREVAEGALAPFIGTVGEITADQLEELGEPYQPGDQVGTSGLERHFERELAGEPRGAVRIVDDEGDEVTALHEHEGAEPEPVTVTLDAAVQQAADAAMERVGGEGALVAVDVDSGGILAAVDRPTGGFPRWRVGGYAPGSTFKVVTAVALLDTGVDVDDEMDCPATITATGREFRNAGGLQLGTVPFREAFAESCNTAFIGAAAELPAGALTEAAVQFGFGGGYDLLGGGVAASFPEPADGAEHAAQSIGQGRISAAPVHMASVAAATASGTWRQPHVRDGQQVDSGPPLPPETVDALATMMRETVTDGTGTAADVDDVDVYGKTGTAQFGDDGEHAWFIGHADGVAFAVLVEDGGAGGAVAAPIAGALLDGLR